MKVPALLASGLLAMLSFPAWTEEPAAKPMRQFLCVLRLTPEHFDDAAWTEADKQSVQLHFQRLQEGAKTGRVILAGRTEEVNSKTMGLVIFEAPDEKAALEYALADPAVVAGVMTAEVRPYRVAVSR